MSMKYSGLLFYTAHTVCRVRIGLLVIGIEEVEHIRVLFRHAHLEEEEKLKAANLCFKPFFKSLTDIFNTSHVFDFRQLKRAYSVVGFLTEFSDCVWCITERFGKV